MSPILSQPLQSWERTQQHRVLAMRVLGRGQRSRAHPCGPLLSKQHPSPPHNPTPGSMGWGRPGCTCLPRLALDWPLTQPQGDGDGGSGILSSTGVCHVALVDTRLLCTCQHQAQDSTSRGRDQVRATVGPAELRGRDRVSCTPQGHFVTKPQGQEPRWVHESSIWTVCRNSEG